MHICAVHAARGGARDGRGTVRARPGAVG